MNQINRIRIKTNRLSTAPYPKIQLITRHCHSLVKMQHQIMARIKKSCSKMFLQLKVFSHHKTSENKAKNMKIEFKQAVTQNMKK